MDQKKIRILHVIYCMNIGGIENWLMNLLRATNKDIFQIDFLVHTIKTGKYDEEIVELGANIFRCPWTTKPLKYSKILRQLIKKYGPYNVVHSHVHHFSGWVLRTAHQVGIPIRIAHSHSNIDKLIYSSSWIRRAYYIYMKYLVKKYATLGIAVSTQAAISLFGPKWNTDNRYRIIQCGINVNLFNKVVDKETVRKKLGIKFNSHVIGHVGRFSEAKNHPFIIDVFSEILKIDSSIRLLLVGDGENLLDIKKLALKKEVEDKIIFTGLRHDIAELMLGAMDIFLIPSLWEGLGLVIIEAQAAGLPCVLSDITPKEADIIPDLICRIPLSEGTKQWAQKIINFYDMKHRQEISQTKILSAIINSPLNFQTGKKKLESIYSK